MFKVLFRVFWKFNFSIKTISKTSLEPNYRIALIELEHRMQSYMSCIFVSILQIHVKFFRIPTLYVNNLELDNNVIIADKTGPNDDNLSFIFIYFLVSTLSAKYFSV